MGKGSFKVSICFVNTCICSLKRKLLGNLEN